MNTVRYLQCLICGERYAPDEVAYVCPRHGREGILDVVYDYEAIARQVSREALKNSRDCSQWRYRSLLPMAPEAVVPPLRVGWTPLYRADRLAETVGLRRVWVKDDGQQPTGSFKDRASALAVVKAREKDAAVITTASSGNAAAALSGLCASVGQPNVIFVPEQAPPAKVAQILAYGSTVFLVQGTYDDAYGLCLEAAEHYGWYNRNTAYNPYMTEGKKTVSYEICEQLNWKAPDVIVVSVGDGCIIGGVHKGLHDLRALRWIDKLPRIIGVQADGSNYLTEAWEQHEEVLTKPAIEARTIADSIRVGLPRDRLKAMRAVTETGGAFLSVSDDDILRAIPLLARTSGVFAEPAGATACAGLIKAVTQERIAPEERVVLINTGSGLKDIRGVEQAAQRVGTHAQRVAPDLASLQEFFSG
ncbi:MAG: threonine synthase [Rhodothermales bacterium]